MKYMRLEGIQRALLFVQLQVPTINIVSYKVRKLGKREDKIKGKWSNSPLLNEKVTGSHTALSAGFVTRCEESR